MFTQHAPRSYSFPIGTSHVHSATADYLLHGIGRNAKGQYCRQSALVTAHWWTPQTGVSIPILIQRSAPTRRRQDGQLKAIMVNSYSTGRAGTNCARWQQRSSRAVAKCRSRDHGTTVHAKSPDLIDWIAYYSWADVLEHATSDMLASVRQHFPF